MLLVIVRSEQGRRCDALASAEEDVCFGVQASGRPKCFRPSLSGRRGGTVTFREDIRAPLARWFEMETLQGKPSRSAAKGYGRGHREGVSAGASSASPDTPRMVAANRSLSNIFLHGPQGLEKSGGNGRPGRAKDWNRVPIRTLTPVHERSAPPSQRPTPSPAASPGGQLFTRPPTGGLCLSTRCHRTRVPPKKPPPERPRRKPLETS